MSITIDVIKPEDCFELLDFELQNRRWFEQHIALRNDDFYNSEGVHNQISEYRDKYVRGEMIPMLVRDSKGVLCWRLNIHRIDMKAKTCEIGYRTGKAHCGKGIASLAVSKLVDRVNQTGKIDIINAIVFTKNLGSIKVLQRNGFIKTSEIAGGIKFVNIMHPASISSLLLS